MISLAYLFNKKQPIQNNNNQNDQRAEAIKKYDLNNMFKDRPVTKGF
jgi:hypothetical protein